LHARAIRVYDPRRIDLVVAIPALPMDGAAIPATPGGVISHGTDAW
jgi:hypothetical protein